MASVSDDYHGQPRPSARTIGAVEHGSAPKKTWPPTFAFSRQAPYTGEQQTAAWQGALAPLQALPSGRPGSTMTQRSAASCDPGPGKARVYDRGWPYDAWAAGSCGDILVDAVAGVGGAALGCWCAALCPMHTLPMRLVGTQFLRLQRLRCLLCAGRRAVRQASLWQPSLPQALQDPQGGTACHQQHSVQQVG